MKTLILFILFYFSSLFGYGLPTLKIPKDNVVIQVVGKNVSEVDKGLLTVSLTKQLLSQGFSILERESIKYVLENIENDALLTQDSKQKLAIAGVRYILLLYVYPLDSSTANLIVKMIDMDSKIVHSGNDEIDLTVETYVRPTMKEAEEIVTKKYRVDSGLRLNLNFTADMEYIWTQDDFNVFFGTEIQELTVENYHVKVGFISGMHNLQGDWFFMNIGGGYSVFHLDGKNDYDSRFEGPSAMMELGLLPFSGFRTGMGLSVEIIRSTPYIRMFGYVEYYVFRFGYNHRTEEDTSDNVLYRGRSESDMGGVFLGFTVDIYNIERMFD